MIRNWILHNWRSKLVSLLISVSIWYLINSNIGTRDTEIPVPGTGTLVPPPPTLPSGQPLEDTILGPIAPPVPGSSGAN